MGGNLKAKYVIHAVGPVWKNTDKEPQLLKDAVLNALTQANYLGCKSVSIPAISSGIFGFPKDLCAQLMMQTIERFVGTEEIGELHLKEVRLTNFDDETYQIFSEEFHRRYVLDVSDNVENCDGDSKV